MANILVAGAIAGEVCITGIKYPSVQGDSAIVNILKNCGADVKIENDCIKVEKSHLHSFKYDATHTPDLVPALTALAIHCEGESEISGIERLRNKESSRAEVLVKEFSKIGGNINIKGNKLMISKSKLISGKTNSHNDHRIAMALTVTALACENATIEIQGAECVNKSYANFFEDIKKIGGQII